VRWNGGGGRMLAGQDSRWPGPCGSRSQGLWGRVAGTLPCAATGPCGYEGAANWVEGWVGRPINDGHWPLLAFGRSHA